MDGRARSIVFWRIGASLSHANFPKSSKSIGPGISSFGEVIGSSPGEGQVATSIFEAVS
jgi:hypothetical protein